MDTRLAPLFFMTGVLIALTPSPARAIETPGDLNGDGKVSVPDAVSALRIAVGLTGAGDGQRAAADVNGDGRVTVQDVILILRAAVGLRPLPPPRDPPPPAENEVPLRWNVPFAAGTRVGVPWLGVSFVVPNEWSGGIADGSSMFLMASASHPGMLAAAMGLALFPDRLTVDRVAQFLNAPQDVGGGVVFTPVESPAVDGSRITVSYRGTRNGFPASLVGYGRGEVAPVGSGVMFLAAGAEKDDALLRELVAGLSASARFREPEPKLSWWSEAVAGRKYRVDTSFYHNNPYIDNTVSGEDTTFTDLCANGSFHYLHKGYTSTSAGYINVEDEKQGRWIVAIDLLGPALVLLPNDGSPGMELRLQTDGRRVVLGGNSTTVLESDFCATAYIVRAIRSTVGISIVEASIRDGTPSRGPVRHAVRNENPRARVLRPSRRGRSVSAL